MTRPSLASRVLASSSLLSTLLLAGCLGQAALRPGDPVPRPEDHRSWFHVKSMVIQPGHALHEAFGGVHHVYANDLARAGLANGHYGDGAVFVFDLLAAEEGGHAIAEGPRKVLGVMHKSSAAFAETGGWGFAGFTDDGRNVVTDMRAQCFQCHEPQRASGYVFSRPRP